MINNDETEKAENVNKNNELTNENIYNKKNTPQIIDSELISETLEMFEDEDESSNVEVNIDETLEENNYDIEEQPEENDNVVIPNFANERFVDTESNDSNQLIEPFEEAIDTAGDSSLVEENNTVIIPNFTDENIEESVEELSDSNEVSEPFEEIIDTTEDAEQVEESNTIVIPSFTNESYVETNTELTDSNQSIEPFEGLTDNSEESNLIEENNIITTPNFTDENIEESVEELSDSNEVSEPFEEIIDTTEDAEQVEESNTIVIPSFTNESYVETNTELTDSNQSIEPFEGLTDNSEESNLIEENNIITTPNFTDENIEEPIEDVNTINQFSNSFENNTSEASEINNPFIGNPINDSMEQQNNNFNIFEQDNNINNLNETPQEFKNQNQESDNDNFNTDIPYINVQANNQSEINNETIPQETNDNISETPVVSSNNSFMENAIKVTEPSATDNAKDSTNHPKYIGYELRICLKLVSAIMLFIAAGIFLVISANSYKKSEVTYNESSTIDYKVCLEKNEHYKDECLNSGMEYLSAITKTIPVSFTYNALYTTEVDYNYKYSIESTLKITKPEEENKVLYTTDEILLKEQVLKGNANVATISENIEIPFKKYNDYVNEYNNKYSLNSDSHVEVALYIEENNKKKKIAGVVVPLSVQTFNVVKEEISNTHLPFSSSKEHYKKMSQIYSIVACILCLIGIIIIVRLIIYVLKSTTKKSEYEIKLNQILREYDRIIVQVENGNELIGDKRIIKVSSFLELLDARDTLEKPIVHVKVNNIKSEFYVEDLDKAYKYTMKESDFTKKQ